MRYKHKMFVMTSGQTKKNLILVITRKFHDVTNTKITGEMKDETPCEITKEYNLSVFEVKCTLTSKTIIKIIKPLKG